MHDDDVMLADAGDGAGRVVDAVVDGCRALAAAGLGDLVWGQAGMRDPDGRGVWMKAGGWGFDEVDSTRVVLVSPDGQVLAGGGLRLVEFPIRTEIMRVRSDVGAVVRAHPIAAIALAATGEPLRPISHDACLLVPPDVARFTATADLIRTPKLGRRLAETLGEGNAVLIPGHGIVKVGGDMVEAVMTAVLLERACDLQLRAQSAGLRYRSSDGEALCKRTSCWLRAQLEVG